MAVAETCTAWGIPQRSTVRPGVRMPGRPAYHFPSAALRYPPTARNPEWRRQGRQDPE
jgi:hypothetical protein